RPVLPNEAGLDMGGDLAATQPFCETIRPVSTVPEQGNGMPGDLIGFPSQDALECRVAALDGLIPAEQRDANGRGIENRLQFGGRPAEFRRSLGHLRFQFAAHLAKVLLRQCALECGSGVIRSDREEQQVDLGGKVTASAGPAAMSRGCRPTQATGKLETASRSLSAVRSRRISPLASVSIQLAIVLLRAGCRSRISRKN